MNNFDHLVLVYNYICQAQVHMNDIYTMQIGDCLKDLSENHFGFILIHIDVKAFNHLFQVLALAIFQYEMHVAVGLKYRE